MAATSRSTTQTAKQLRAAERIAEFTAEQRRLKTAAASRREAAASSDGPTHEGFVGLPESPPPVARRSQYLQ